jgi:gliding motility-associated-like protein
VGTSTICQYNTETYTVNASPGSNYSWTVTGGIVIGGTTSNTLIVKWNNIGTGSITVNEANSFGCTGSYSLPVAVLTRPVPVINGSTTGCINNTASTYTAPWIANTNYIWNVSGGTIVGLNGPNSVDIAWATSGTNTVSLRVINTNTGCDSTITINVQVDALGPPVVQSSTIQGCPPLTVHFTGNNPAPGQTYAWNFGDLLYSSVANPTHVYYTSGMSTVTVVTTNATGCIDSATGTVNVYTTPNASFAHNYLDDIYYIDEGSLVFTNTSTGGFQYTWTFGNGDSAFSFEPPYEYHTAGDYVIQLYVANNWGCVDVAENPIRVRARESVYVPNAFSPNGDDVNDYFSVGKQNIASLNIVIFNRWGEVFYTSDDVNFHWDGTYHGNPRAARHLWLHHQCQRPQR